MFQIFSSLITKPHIINRVNKNVFSKISVRTFLSQAYYCQEVWDQRLNSPLLQKVNLDELYHELDQRFQKSRQISAVDVDIFANAIQDETFLDELLDLVHKLRLSADTGNTLNSTSHAVVRFLMKVGKFNDLLTLLDDRINYGVFLDFYTTNILLDTFWKSKNYALGAQTASQLMLQEDFGHPVSSNFSLLHCFNYLRKPENWPEYPQPEEPEEEVKIRVKYIRNPYFDDHFDLRDGNKIVGKTVAMICKGKNDSLSKSFEVVGQALYEKQDKVKDLINECISKNVSLYKEVLDVLPEENEARNLFNKVKIESTDIDTKLKNNVEKAVQESSERDISEQCKIFSHWEEERIQALERQKQRLLTAKRLSNIEDLKKMIKEKEEKLWFFENEEKIELEIEEKSEELKKSLITKKTKKTKTVDEDYVPPEIFSKQTNPRQF